MPHQQEFFLIMPLAHDITDIDERHALQLEIFKFPLKLNFKCIQKLNQTHISIYNEIIESDSIYNRFK